MNWEPVVGKTKKGKKAAGFEYWSARPFNKQGGIVGPFTKHRTHKAERSAGRREARK